MKISKICSVLFEMLRNSVEFSLGSSIETKKMSSPTPSNSNSNKNLQLLFDRPKEPIFLPKGDKKMIFVMPQNFYLDRYQSDLKPITDWMDKETSDHKIVINALKNMPDLTIPMQMGVEENFSFFSDDHRRVASQLVRMYLKTENVEELMVNRIKN